MTVEKVDDKKKIQTNENGQESTRTDIHTYIHSSMIMNDPCRGPKVAIFGQKRPKSAKSAPKVPSNKKWPKILRCF